MATQDERSAATRSLIVAAAAELFAAGGFEATAMSSIAEAAGVSKGALYHHFSNKRSIMAAVYEEAERLLVERLMSAVAGETRPLEAIRKGSHEFLRACLDPRRRTLLLVEAPAALGWEEWRRLDAQFGLGLLRAGVDAALAAGHLPPLEAEATAQALLAVLMEGALMIGSADHPKRALDNVLRVFDAVLDGLATTAGGRPQRRG